MTKRNTALPGHGLWFEGAPHILNSQGKPIRVHDAWGGTGGEGRGVCRCGAYSDELPSGGARKRWHLEHKESVEARRSAGSES